LHHIELTREHVEYYLTDLNRELKNTEIKIYFRFEHMSTFGFYYGNQYLVGSFIVPDKYSGNAKR